MADAHLSKVKWAVDSSTYKLPDVEGATLRWLRQMLAAFDDFEFVAFENLISEGVDVDRMARWSRVESTDRGLMVDGVRACRIMMLDHMVSRSDDHRFVIDLLWEGAFAYLNDRAIESAKRVAAEQATFMP